MTTEIAALSPELGLELGVRQKLYESTSFLDGIIGIRVDGKNFHGWTRKVTKERFDEHIHDAMVDAATMTSDQLPGFKLAYIQSDECTFILNAHQHWFGGNKSKLESIVASYFTLYFNCHSFQIPAFFDTRAFTLPAADAANNIVWREKDWARNSVQTLARMHFSHKDLKGVNIETMHKMLAEKNVYWNKLDSWKRFGTFVVPGETGNRTAFSAYQDYWAVDSYIQ